MVLKVHDIPEPTKEELKEQKERHQQRLLEQRTKDLQFIEFQTLKINQLKCVPDKRVFCLKGCVLVDTPQFAKRSFVWYVGQAPDTDGFKSFFIKGKDKTGKWVDVKFISRKTGLIDFKYIDVPVGFANDRGLYKLTKDQIIQNIENSINLRSRQIEHYEPTIN